MSPCDIRVVQFGKSPCLLHVRTHTVGWGLTAFSTQFRPYRALKVELYYYKY